MNNSGKLYLAALGATVVSVLWIDLPLAGWLAAGLRYDAFALSETNLPDHLGTAVTAATIACWVGFGLLRWLGHNNPHSDFLRLAGTVLPLSFGLKIFLKWIFGRMNTRFWLWSPDQYGFHWFNSDQGFQGFPSGHMLVATPVFFAFAATYPRFRLPILGIWALLAVTLVATNYHFLGDVIAGAMAGALLYQGAAATWRRFG